MATVPTQVRIDENLKKQASELFAQLGMDMSGAMNIFLRQCVLRGGLPFSVELPQYKPEVLEAMEEAKKISKDPDTKRYSSLSEALEDELILTGKFKKSLKLAKRRGLNLELLDEVVTMLQKNIPLEEKYRDHELKGKYQGFRECHIQPDWLLIYLKENDVLTLTLVDTGSHADLFNM